MKTITNKLKFAAFAIAFAAVGTVNAQTTTGNITVQGNAVLGSANTAVRVVDNKGTKKFLQVANGLTSFTNTAPNGGITTTWQLGGTLTSNTYIDVNGNEFGLTNLNSVAAGAAAVADAGDADDGIANTGWTLVVRNEATGELQKLLATDLLQSGHSVFTATVAGAAPVPAELVFDLTVDLPAFEKVWVYRNGAKLVAGIDYTIAGTEVTLVPGTTAPNDWTLFGGDVIEVQFVK